MPCNKFPLAHGGYAIVCHRSRPKKPPKCYVCGMPGLFLCDYPTGDDGKTCDRAMCKTHAWQAGPVVHYCFAHWRLSLPARPL